MSVLDQIVVLFVVFSFVAVLENVIRKYHIPLNILLVLLGFAGSEIALLFVDDLGIRWQHIHDLIFYVLIPIILFQTVFKLDFRLHGRDYLPIFFLTVPLNIISILLLATLFYYLIGHSEAFPFQSALLAAALVSTTSPNTMAFLLKQGRTDKHVSNVMIGESLFNGVIAISLFMYLVNATSLMNTDEAINYLGLIPDFLKSFVLAVFIGVIVGWLMQRILRWVEPGFRYTVVTIAGCFSSYYIAIEWANAFATVSILTTALMLLHYMLKHADQSCSISRTIWDFMRYLSSITLYLLMGVSLTWSMFIHGWLALLIGVFAVILVRLFIAYGLFSALVKLIRRPAYTTQEKKILFMGAMRGGTTVALALSIPETIEGWWYIQVIAYGAVIYGISVQQFILSRSLLKGT